MDGRRGQTTAQVQVLVLVLSLRSPRPGRWPISYDRPILSSARAITVTSCPYDVKSLGQSMMRALIHALTP